MDTNEFAVLKLFLVGVLDQETAVATYISPSARRSSIFLSESCSDNKINASMMRGVSATDGFNVEPTSPRPRKICNESRLEWEVEVCGEDFKRDMAHIDPQYWCNLTHFISEYHLFTLCTETKSHIFDCYWPNPLVESYIIRIHKHFFSNCTIEQVVWVDPPDDTLTILILIPVFLTLAMIALVVWCSKRSDILA